MNLNKHQLILRDIAHKHLPEYQQGNQLPTLITNWRHYNVEHIVEDAMAHVGGYTYVDEDHYDNSDYSETKTGTLRQHDKTVTLTNIVSRNGLKPKAGDIRAVIYNEFTHELEYYFLPKAEWELLREYGESNRNILRARYNPDQGRIPKWHKFKVDSFDALARMPATITSPHDYQPVDTPKNTLFDWNPQTLFIEA